jgi:amidohydrolase
MGAMLSSSLSGVRMGALHSKERIIGISKCMEAYTIGVRRILHSMPELGWEEEKTLSYIITQIQAIAATSDLRISLEIKEGGIWVDVDVDPHKPRLLFRADVDALPIEEETGLPFASKHPGVMHACGHDCHSAMLLGALKAIGESLIIPELNLRFVWQRSEEYTSYRSGGKTLVKEGVCEDVDAAFALHISSIETAGLFSSKPGIFMANSAQIQFGIVCSGGHVMRPEIGSNAIYIMNDIQNALRGFEGLFFPPNEPIAFVPSIARAGGAANIRPAHADMCFAIRNFLTTDKRAKFVQAVKEKILTIAKSYPTGDLSYFTFHEGYPPLSNDDNEYRRVDDLLTDQGFKTKQSGLVFAGEDFSYYLKEVPGSFWVLGARQEPAWDHHTSRFNPDERYLWQGVAFWLALATH